MLSVVIFIILAIFKLVNIGVVLGLRMLYFFLVQHLSAKTILGLDAIALRILIPKLCLCFFMAILSY